MKRRFRKTYKLPRINGHTLVGIDGFVDKMPVCSCGWTGRKWEAPFTSKDRRAYENASNEWFVHAKESEQQ